MFSTFLNDNVSENQFLAVSRTLLLGETHACPFYSGKARFSWELTFGPHVIALEVICHRIKLKSPFNLSSGGQREIIFSRSI